MSGPKCDEIVLSREEEQRLQKIYEEQLRKERELLRRKREEERRERMRLEELEKERREKERRRREEEQRKKQQDYRDGMAEYIRQLQETERESAADGEAAEYVRQPQQPDWEQDGEAFDEAYETYMAACAVAGIKPRCVVRRPVEGKRQLEELREETRKLKEQAVAFACGEQVDGWIDRTIEGMGYHIIGKKEQAGETRAVSKLYRYDKNTALHVIGVGGQFTMEIVATDNKERPLSAAERDDLVDSMEHFCEDYRKIREKLEASGELQIKNVFHMPADRKYAALMNETDYKKAGKKRVVSAGADYTAASVQEKEAKRRYE